MKIVITAIVTLALLLITGSATAQVLLVQQDSREIINNNTAQQIRRAQQQNAAISQRQALELARKQFAGRVIGISLVGEGRQQRYRIRLDHEGNIFTLTVNASTGKVSRE